jgi:uncharacterized membrane protein YgdD (TMEM256/DUF423 family)
MQRIFLLIASLLGALSVMLGAFAAHGLKQILAPDVMQTFETAVRYQVYHVFALISVAFFFQYYSAKLLKWAGNFFIAGILLFSGSLYLLCFIKHMHFSGILWVGAITPFGGLCFITGWLLLAFTTAKNKSSIR